MATHVEKTDEQWRQELTPEQYEVLRKGATERAFTGKYWDAHEDGMYRCAACGAELFSSDVKFDSGTGWPSFTEPKVAEAVETRPDNSWGMNRTEVVCRNCGGHLGHLFDDGPRDAGGLRYCINSCALDFDGRWRTAAFRAAGSAAPRLRDVLTSKIDHGGRFTAHMGVNRPRTHGDADLLAALRSRSSLAPPTRSAGPDTPGPPDPTAPSAIIPGA
jgi:peptide-methionine (R)-S-oxide reductase